MTQTHRSGPQLRRAVLSSYLGSVIEYYDFLLYATASALVFNKVFFSNLDPLVGTVASFGTLATGYFARPLGGIVFGHFGDRIGRKKMLVLSMTIMAVGSTLIGLLPTYAQIGVWAPILLVLLRVVQGIAIGGEWGGAVLMSAEHATSRRGLWASFTNAGAPSGMVLSSLVLAASASFIGEAAFLVWGWRIPFLLSVVLLAVGLFVRLRVAETPVFEDAARAKPTSPPLMDVLRHHPRNLLLSIGVGFAAFVVQGTLTTFVISYAVQAGFPRPTVLNALTLSPRSSRSSGSSASSALSDRVGRRPVVLAGAARDGLFAFVLFPMIDSGAVAAADARRGHRPGRPAPRDVRAARRALRRALLHPLPLHRRVARLPDRRASARASRRSSSPRCSPAAAVRHRRDHPRGVLPAHDRLHGRAAGDVVRRPRRRPGCHRVRRRDPLRRDRPVEGSARTVSSGHGPAARWRRSVRARQSVSRFENRQSRGRHARSGTAPFGLR